MGLVKNILMPNTVLKMMRYKLVISDYGETLVHTGEDINQINIDAIKEYQLNGGVFSIATGREWPSIRRKLNKRDLINLNEMIITCCYGALIISSKKEEVLFDFSLDSRFIIRLISFMSENDVKYSIVTKDKTLVKKEIDLNNYVWKQYDNQMVFNDDVSLIDYLIKNEDKVYKIDIYSINHYSLINDYIVHTFPNKIRTYTNNALGFFELVSVDAGKESAYKFIKKYLNLNDEEIIVVGDATNDLGLYKNATNRIAVSNAIKDLLEKSTYIVENSDYCGISRLIKNILNGDTL